MEWLRSVRIVILTFSRLWLIEESDYGDILTFSILWLSGESDDGDFDFFDIVTDLGRVTDLGEDWVNCNRNKIKWSVILISLSKMIFVVLDL